MSAEGEGLVCANHERGAELVVGKKPATEKPELGCFCGSELKKLYHPPVLTVFGTLVGECPSRSRC